MGKRIVIALGGNALGKNLPEQMLAVKETSKAIADLVEAGHTVVVAHGNGPQVGMIQNAFAAYCRQKPSADVMPLSMCVAMSQGYIGYDLQNALKEELLNRGLQQGVATDHHHLKGAAAVIDKDLASELLAEHLDADMLIILTAVEKVAVNFNKPNQKWLDTLTPEEARTYIGEGQFAPGSMLPKVEAAVKFAESKPGRTALITLLEKARDGIDGKTGTRVTC